MLEGYPDVLDKKQVMEILSIGNNTANKMLKNGEIQNRKIGGAYKVPKIALINYLLKIANE